MSMASTGRATAPAPAIRDRVSDALAEPRLVRLEPDLVAVALEVMKIIPARYVIEKALREGHVRKGSLVVESSSGNLALGLAIVCREHDLRLKIVGDPAIDAGLRHMLTNLGAEVDIIERPDAQGSFQRLRLQRVRELLQANPGAFWVRQYDTPSNPASYRGLAATLLDVLGGSFDLVASVGSGGSAVGLGRALRELRGDIRLTGVDTFNSVLFGLPDGSRPLRGLGNSVMPAILDHSQFDSIHWVNAQDSNRAALELHAGHGLFCGPTSGAAYRVARWQARQGSGRLTAFVAPDSGHRYVSALFPGNFEDDPLPSPLRVEALSEVDPRLRWCSLQWNRRTLDEVRSAIAAPTAA
jgi:cysteine synthase